MFVRMLLDMYFKRELYRNLLQYILTTAYMLFSHPFVTVLMPRTLNDNMIIMFILKLAYFIYQN